MRYLYRITFLDEKNIMSAVSVRLPDELSNGLQALADKTGRSKTYYIVEAVNDKIAAHVS